MWLYDWQKDLFWEASTSVVILGEEMPMELFADVKLVGQCPRVLLP